MFFVEVGGRMPAPAQEAERRWSAADSITVTWRPRCESSQASDNPTTPAPTIKNEVSFAGLENDMELKGMRILDFNWERVPGFSPWYPSGPMGCRIFLLSAFQN
jgi:hypothetical protein